MLRGCLQTETPTVLVPLRREVGTLFRSQALVRLTQVRAVLLDVRPGTGLV